MNAEAGQLLIDVMGLQSAAHGERGIARYILEQTTAILRTRPEAVGGLLLDPELGWGRSLEPLLATGLLRWSDPLGPSGVPLQGPATYYVTSPFELRPLREQWPSYARAADVRTVVTLYDLIPMIYEDHYLADPIHRARYEARLELVRHADLVLTISQATADDAVRLLGIPENRVTNVGTGVSTFFHPPRDRDRALAEARTSVPDLRTGFLFYTGGIDHRKNLEGLLAGYARLPRKLRHLHQLAITCRIRPEEREHYTALARSLRIADDVLFTGYVSDTTLLHLYQSTELCVFPSLYEGFGLPLAEAMRSGARAIGADSSSMREVIPDPTHRFDPTSPDAIAQRIGQALTDPAFRASLADATTAAASRFSWDDVAARTLDSIDAMHSSAAPTQQQARPRLAFVTPVPPQASGIADHSAQLISALLPWVDVDVFVDIDPDDVALPEQPGLVIRPIASLPTCADVVAYDEFLYAMGNSEYHRSTYEMLAHLPGVVISHDVRYTGFYWWYAHNVVGTADSLRAQVAVQHPDVPASVAERGWIATDDAERHGVLLLEEVLARCSRFLVHSTYAAQAAKVRFPRYAHKVGQMPFGIGPPVERPRPTDPVIASFGIVAEVKRLRALVRAVPLVRERVADARLVIVGGGDQTYADGLAKLAADLGVADAVELTGRVPQDEYDAWLDRTACAVQLRASSNGETSAAVADCLRRGIPTVVSDMGSSSDYPEDVVARVGRVSSPEAIADAILGILTDEARATLLTDGARRFVAASSFDSAARSLLEHILPRALT